MSKPSSNDAKRVRECTLPTVAWEEDGMSLVETLRRENAKLKRENAKLKKVIEELEATIGEQENEIDKLSGFALVPPY